MDRNVQPLWLPRDIFVWIQKMMLLMLGTDCSYQIAKRYQFSERGGCIGRSADCDWVLDCSEQLISRRHALVSFHSGQFWLTDLSTNGVYLNGANESVGCGNCVAITDGDRLRLGSIAVTATVVDEAEDSLSSIGAGIGTGQRAGTDPRRAGLTLPLSLSPQAPHQTDRSPSGDHLASALSSLRAATANDAFTPPKAIIPDDWALTLEGLPEEVQEPPGIAVNRRLSVLQQAASSALWGELLPGSGDGGSELTPHVAAALGRSLRLCLELVVALRAEYELVDKRLRGVQPSASGGEAQPEIGGEADRLARELLSDQQCGEQVAELEGWLRSLCGRQTALLDGCGEGLTAIADQFAPEKFEVRWREARKEKRMGGRAGNASPLDVPFADIPFTKAGLWRFYSAWHRQQRADSYHSMHQLFRNKVAAVCQRLRKAEACKALEKAVTPSVNNTAPLPAEV